VPPLLHELILIIFWISLSLVDSYGPQLNIVSIYDIL
jgi:hypothetical protein